MASKGNKKKIEDVLAGATEKVLKDISSMYTTGLSEGPSALGLCRIAESPQLGITIRPPRKKVTIMIVGNHSAGKSSFINWYIQEGIQKTGVAIETRGFTFVASGKRRETLTGDATLRFFPFLDGFTRYEGIVPNLFTEISTSREKNFLCCDFIDSPGLVDGNMLYPFPVEEAICWLADHVDLILVFLDPIGQATCKRTMDVVKRLNDSANLEKVHYFMSKADAVEKEHDRQRVLIQITQNLASRIKNSHAFNLPTFYLPKDDGTPCTIPNAIEEVCKEIDKAINMTVQKSLKGLKDDCTRILERCDQVVVQDREQKAANLKRRLQGILFWVLTGVSVLILLAMFASLLAPSVCAVSLNCHHSALQAMISASPIVREHSSILLGGASVAVLVLAIVTHLVWRIQKVFNKKDLQAISTFKATTQAILQQEADLYKQYFETLSHADR
mmetsp:Transcript_17397/g.29842  ORF Transcript_17397/g.29842 Transcript_17397/m.29842 type:complete len:445 (+) Transcript_17397:172-1506(+)